jgi:hypothetical protein
METTGLTQISLIKQMIEAAPRTIIPVKSAPQKPTTTVISTKDEKKPINERKKVVVEKNPLDNLGKIQKDKKEFIDHSKVRQVDGIQLEIYDFFSRSPESTSNEDIRKLSFIHNWAFRGTDDLFKAMKRIEDIEIRLGRTDETNRLSRIYNHVKIRSLR